MNSDTPNNNWNELNKWELIKIYMTTSTIIYDEKRKDNNNNNNHHHIGKVMPFPACEINGM